MRRFLRPAWPDFAGALFGIWARLARPAAGGAVKGASGRGVRQLLHGPEDRALEGAGEQQPPPADVPMFRVRRLLLVDQAPDLIEELLAEEACQQPPSDRHGGEEQLRHSRCIPDGRSAKSAALCEVGRLEAYLERSRREAAPHAPSARHAAKTRVRVLPDDRAPECAAVRAGREGAQYRLVTVQAPPFGNREQPAPREPPSPPGQLRVRARVTRGLGGGRNARSEERMPDCGAGLPLGLSGGGSQGRRAY